MTTVAASAKTILIVDDEEDILYSLEALLRRDVPQAQIRTATSGGQALQVLDREPVHLIISDYKMPGMDGFQFLAEVRRRNVRAPTIMMTAYPDPSIAAQAVQEFGVGLFIAKPFDLQYMVDVIRSILAGSSPTAPRATAIRR